MSWFRSKTTSVGPERRYNQFITAVSRGEFVRNRGVLFNGVVRDEEIGSLETKILPRTFALSIVVKGGMRLRELIIQYFRPFPYMYEVLNEGDVGIMIFLDYTAFRITVGNLAVDSKHHTRTAILGFDTRH